MGQLLWLSADRFRSIHNNTQQFRKTSRQDALGNVGINTLDLIIDDRIEFFDSSRVISWLLAALMRNVNHIHLKFPVSQPLELPHQMFTPTSNLQGFILSSSWFKADARVRMPNSLCTAPRIRHLHLYQVLFPDGDINGELVLTCPLLEDLELDRCDVSNLEILAISTPRLEKLKLMNVFTNQETSCKVKTYTPSLQELNIQGDEESDRQFIVDYFMEDLSSLTKADIDVHTDQEADVRRKRWSTSFLGILSKVPNLQSLELSAPSIQILTQISELLQRLPNLFHNLKYLRLEDPCKAPIHIWLKIMTGVPRLETLEWFSCSFSKHEPWPEELSFDCVFHHLKSIKIENFCGRANDFTFLELLLKKAIVQMTRAWWNWITSCMLFPEPPQL